MILNCNALLRFVLICFETGGCVSLKSSFSVGCFVQSRLANLSGLFGVLGGNQCTVQADYSGATSVE